VRRRRRLIGRESDEWEPIVCGPYERRTRSLWPRPSPRGEPLLAVVEPLMPSVDAGAIRAEIALARAAADAASVSVDAPAFETRRVRPGRALTQAEEGRRTSVS
jgi:hypothetical protein